MTHEPDKTICLLRFLALCWILGGLCRSDVYGGRVMRRLVLLAALVVPVIASAAKFEAKVVAVSDGDTITVTTGKPCVAGSSCFKGELSHRIRLAEIDAPERKQPYGPEAKKSLVEMVLGQRVVIDDRGQRSYSRIVAHVFKDDVWINREQVANGFAWVDPRYSRRHELRLLQRQAIRSEIGLWSLPDKEQIPPWEWRKLYR